MAQMTLEIDAQTEARLRQLSQTTGGDVERLAARMLARAVRAAQPRPTFDTEAVRRANAEFAEEDATLADSGSAERAELLREEDTA